MCRMLDYIGASVLLQDLVVRPDNALLNRTTDALLLAMLNIAGFGLAAWNDNLVSAHLPLTFHSTNVAVFYANLRAVAAAQPSSAPARRGAGWQRPTINQQSLHPFQLAGSPLMLAHNGDLAEFAAVRTALWPHIEADIARQMMALTDSSFLHALVLSQVEDPAGPSSAAQISRAITGTLRVDQGIPRSSSVNLGAAVVVACWWHPNR